MERGTFTTAHILSLLFAMIINIVLFLLLKILKEPYRRSVAFLVSLLGICAIIYNLVKWDSPLEYLPLELCSLNAIILPIFVITKSKVLGNTLILWSLGALMALVMNHGASNFDIYGEVFFFYFYPHAVEFGLPIIFILLGYIKLESKYIFSTLGITAFAYTLAHFSNVAINNYCLTNNIVDYANNVIQVNYMYSIHPSGIPVLTTFKEWIPYSYWYMYLILPIVIAYLGIIYFINYLVKRKRYFVVYIN